MNSSDQARQMLGQLSIDQVRAYLLSRHWYEDGKIKNVATIWHLIEDEEAEVVLPLPSAKDFAQRLRDALSAIALVEARDVAQIIADIRRNFASVISVRVVHADTADGTIPINDGVLLIAKAKDLLSAAAQSLYAKKKQFSGKTSAETRAYLDSLLLGQTEIGSFVVNVFAPIQPDVLAPNTDVRTPLAAAVTQNLVTGLDALNKASREYTEVGDFRVFDSAVLAGASSNLCEALLGFSGENRARAFEVTVAPAAGHMFENEPRHFSFDAQQVRVLEKANSYFKEEYVLQSRTLVGHILKLSRPKNEKSGTVTLQATVGDVERNVRIELSGDDYHLAVLAHDSTELVRVDGDVLIKSKSAWLLSPTNFGVIKLADLF